jgi:hypothetical protein
VNHLDFTARQRMAIATNADQFSSAVSRLREQVRDALEITDADHGSFEKDERACYRAAIDNLEAAAGNLVELAAKLRGTVRDPADGFPSERAVAGVFAYVSSIGGETCLDENAKADLAMNYNVAEEEAIAAAETLADRGLIGLEGQRDAYHVWTLNNPGENTPSNPEAPY